MHHPGVPAYRRRSGWRVMQCAQRRWAYEVEGRMGDSMEEVVDCEAVSLARVGFEGSCRFFGGVRGVEMEGWSGSCG